MRNSRQWLVVGTVLVMAASSWALDAEQERLCTKAETLIRSAQADIDSAKGSAGTAANPAKGSRLKLTKMRTDSARQRLAEATKLLEGLPIAEEKVAAALQAHVKASEGLAAIDAILGGGAAPVPADAPKLDYQQEKLVKDARWHLGDVDRLGAKATSVVQRFADPNDQPVHREVVAALELVKQAKAKHGLAHERLQQLPADHPAVAPVIANAAEAWNALEALETRFTAEEERLGKLASLDSYPKYQEDLKLLNDLMSRYRDFGDARNRPEVLAQVISEDATVLAELQRMAQTYTPLISQKTTEGERMGDTLNYFHEKRNAFAQGLIAYKAELPGLFDKDLAEANRLADQGVGEKRPAYFGPSGGIAQQLGFARQKLGVMEALDPNAAAPYREKLGATEASMREKAKSLSAEIIASNDVPPDRYQGADRADLIDRAKKAWQAEEAGAKFLAAGIASEAWTRDTRWRYGADSFYKIDRSTLQVQLLVAHDDELAAIRPVNLVKDHMKSDTIKAYPMDRLADELPPIRFVRREKIK